MGTKNVVVAMSGGVDSSVAAALMVQKGYNVTGIMLKLWTSDCSTSENSCCTPDAINEAQEVAGILKIPFYVIDVKQEFKEIVVERFIEMSEQGLTPNPCYFCNQSIRWGLLLEKSRKMGAEFLVTGHYANIEEGNDGLYLLKKGFDTKKDQSYVLSGLNQAQLRHTLFPLGKYTKENIRLMAEDLHFSVARKPDSQDLCFVGDGGYREFLLKYSKTPRPVGKIRDLNGKVVGEHSGLANFTIGQRKGLGSGFQEPVYVINKDIDQNELTVGSKEALLFKEIVTEPFHWILEKQPDFTRKFEVKIRYKANPVKGKISDEGNGRIRFKFDTPVRDATPGQVAVIYDGEEVLGSGLILDIVRETK